MKNQRDPSCLPWKVLFLDSLQSDWTFKRCISFSLESWPSGCSLLNTAYPLATALWSLSYLHCSVRSLSPIPRQTAPFITLGYKVFLALAVYLFLCCCWEHSLQSLQTGIGHLSVDEAAGANTREKSLCAEELLLIQPDYTGNCSQNRLGSHRLQNYSAVIQV